MTRNDTELGELVRVTAATIEPTAQFDARLSDRILHHTRRRVRGRSAAGVGAALAAAAATVAVIALPSPGPEAPRVDPLAPTNAAPVVEPTTSATSPSPRVPENWSDLPLGPVTRPAHAVWIDDELLIVDDCRVAECEAVMVTGPADGSNWTMRAPVPTGFDDADGAVWTGSHLLLIATHPAVGVAIYDTAADTWAIALDGPLLPREDAAIIWAGDRLVIWGGATLDNNVATGATADGALFDPLTKSWDPMANSPLQARGAAAVAFDGTAVHIAGGGAIDSEDSEFAEKYHYELTDAASYALDTNTWTSPSDIGAGGPSVAAAWTSAGMLMWTGGLGAEAGAIWNPTSGTVTPLAGPSMLDAARSHGAGSVWDGRTGRLVVWGGPCSGCGQDRTLNDGAVYDVAAARWSSLPDGPLSDRENAVLVLTDTGLAVIGGRSTMPGSGGMTDTASDAAVWHSNEG
jgi:hypothetical protein